MVPGMGGGGVMILRGEEMRSPGEEESVGMELLAVRRRKALKSIYSHGVGEENVFVFFCSC